MFGMHFYHRLKNKQKQCLDASNRDLLKKNEETKLNKTGKINVALNLAISVFFLNTLKLS